MSFGRAPVHPCPRGSITVDVAGERFIALPERALYWPRQGMLLIADLHLGKSDIFRAFGVAVPQSVQMDDLGRLDGLLERFAPAALVILGDFVHGAFAGPQTRERWQALRDTHPATRVILTRGNHDRTLSAAQWNLDSVLGEWMEDGVLLSHEPRPKRDGAPCFSLNIHGHIHPVFRDRQWRRGLPALVHEGLHLAMPAFSAFTAGVSCHTAQSRVWVFLADGDPLVLQVR